MLVEFLDFSFFDKSFFDIRLKDTESGLDSESLMKMFNLVMKFGHLQVDLLAQFDSALYISNLILAAKGFFIQSVETDCSLGVNFRIELAAYFYEEVPLIVSGNYAMKKVELVGNGSIEWSPKMRTSFLMDLIQELDKKLIICM